jgi:putative flavoprotein involved in K+ transport
MSVVVIGAGQAGLAVSGGLSSRGVDHVVLEQAQVAQAWRDRWDSFTLVTPNWTMDLPGSPYAGGDPEGHVARDEIVAYLDGYAAKWSVPVRAGVRVDTIRGRGSHGFAVGTSRGEIEADAVVVCTGGFSVPYLPINGFPPDLAVLTTLDYRNPDSIPDGKVLLIGSGQTGVQLADELNRAGRDVFLSCGRAPWTPKQVEGLDIVTWLHRIGFWDVPLGDLPDPAARLMPNAQGTGRAGGYSLHYRTLQRAGVTLLGRISDVDGHTARFADDLGASVAFGDARWSDMRNLLTGGLPSRGFHVPELEIPEPFTYTPITELDLRGFGAVIFTAGFRPNFGWIDPLPTDPLGFPVTVDGASPDLPGLYFCGLHFMRVRRSGTLFGVGPHAELVAEAIARVRV